MRIRESKNRIKIQEGLSLKDFRFIGEGAWEEGATIDFIFNKLHKGTIFLNDSKDYVEFVLMDNAEQDRWSGYSLEDFESFLDRNLDNIFRRV